MRNDERSPHDETRKKLSLHLTHRHGSRPVNLSLFRRIIRAVLRHLLANGRYDLGVHLVSPAEITRVNEAFLRHRGPTDVIAFDYGGEPMRQSFAQDKGDSRQKIRQARSAFLHGEILICTDEALRQARRFRTTWQRELTRYVIHGLLHLCGYDDRLSATRRQMKCEEDRLLRQISQEFDLARLESRL